MDRRSADTNLVETHQEMNELLGKQLYALNECFKKSRIHVEPTIKETKKVKDS